MDLGKNKLWQIGAGNKERFYGEIFTEYDLMLMGPGNLGDFEVNRNKYEEYYNDTDVNLNSLKRFYHEAQKGDFVLLRIGTNEIIALGQIVDDRPILRDDFNDIDGWDLQHVRRVRWYPNTKKTFPTKTLGGQVRTFAKVGVDKIHSWISKLEITEEHLTRPLKKLPEEPKTLSIEEFGRRLFNEGLPSARVEKLLETFDTLKRIANWYRNPYKRPENRPSENETVAYLVLPMLFSLGWSQQTAAIEWNNIDVALFEKMPVNNENLTCVVEAKLLNRSVITPKGQAMRYALKEGRSNCENLIVTDGIRYSFFNKAEEDFILNSYLNILDLKESYPMWSCKGAVDTIMGMAKW